MRCTGDPRGTPRLDDEQANACAKGDHMSRFFINRPIFAWVLALLVMLAGVLALLNLPVAQFPPLAPPAIAITVSYPGASAETAENTVVQPLEQQMGGLDNLNYMSSESDKDCSITVT